MKDHQCKMLRLQNKKIIIGCMYDDKGIMVANIATISMGEQDLHIQFCPGCGKKITNWNEYYR